MKYLGNKTRLLSTIQTFLESNDISLKNKTVLDGFLGTGSFSSLAFDLGAKKVVGYELLQSMCFYAKYHVEGVTEESYNKVINALTQNPNEGYFYNNFSEDSSRQYFSNPNAIKIDSALSLLDDFTDTEKGLLVDIVDRVSNTTGTYGAYLKIWRSMALKNIEEYKLKFPIKQNLNFKVYNKSLDNDTNKYDFVYLDPPYNSRQYGSYYHILDRLFDQQNITSKTGVTGQEPKSDYASKVKSKKAFKDLIQGIDSKHILISYSNEGIIQENDWIDILSDYDYKIEYFSYRRYKSNSKTSSNTGLKEMLILVTK